MEILGGTGRDGIFLGKILGGTGRFIFFFEAGRGGCCFFPRRDGAVVFFFEAGRDGVVVLFQRRDQAVVFFVRAGTGVFFLAPGRAVNGCCLQRRDGIVYTRAKRGGVTFCEKCHGGA